MLSCCVGSNGTQNSVPSVGDVSQMLSVNNQNQTLVVAMLPLMIDSVALEDPEVINLWMEFVSPLYENIEFVEPSLAVVTIYDDSEFVVTFQFFLTNLILVFLL